MKLLFMDDILFIATLRQLYLAKVLGLKTHSH